MAEASLNGTFGAFLIGIIASSCLFGVTCTQTWYYYTRYSDGIVLKASVGIIWYSSLPIKYPLTLTARLQRILEVLHLAFGSHAIYYYVILHYGDPAALAEGTWSVSLNVSITALIALLVYLYYARRIYQLSNHNIPLVAVVVISSVCRLGTSMCVTGYSLHLKYFVLFDRPAMAGLIRASLALYVVTDLLIAVLLCYFLHSSRTGIKRTDTLINRLIVYAIHNGLITSVADIFVIAFNIAYPKNLVYLSVYQVVANLYSNSFLATLNARRPTKPVNDNFSTNVNTLSLSTFGGHNRLLADTARADKVLRFCLFLVLELMVGAFQRHVDINITTTVEVTGDTDRNSSTSLGSKIVASLEGQRPWRVSEIKSTVEALSESLYRRIIVGDGFVGLLLVLVGVIPVWKVRYRGRRGVGGSERENIRGRAAGVTVPVTDALPCQSPNLAVIPIPNPATLARGELVTGEQFSRPVSPPKKSNNYGAILSWSGRMQSLLMTSWLVLREEDKEGFENRDLPDDKDGDGEAVPEDGGQVRVEALDPQNPIVDPRASSSSSLTVSSFVFPAYFPVSDVLKSLDLPFYLEVIMAS
ncbi:hypothetical protein EDD85DRAFT_1022956 [Armillaria nabsnona]|nr:hypothetical protein EDD85DRAFT_1022956 [Armillaria nabsnona]